MPDADTAGDESSLRKFLRESVPPQSSGRASALEETGKESTPEPTTVSVEARISTSVESGAEVRGEAAIEPPEDSVPPASDLDVLFFHELPSDAWLAHELELRDPRFVLKMTDSVARRRARLARYVVGVVAVSAALCVAALVKSAVPVSDDEPSTGVGRVLGGQPVPLVVPLDTSLDAAADGGG